MFRLTSCLAVFLVITCIKCDVRQAWAETVAADSDVNNLDPFLTVNAVQFDVPIGGPYAGILSHVDAGPAIVGSTAQFRDGTNATGGAETVKMNWRNRATIETFPTHTHPPMPWSRSRRLVALGLFSDVVRVTGLIEAGGQVAGDRTETDVFVLQMDYHWPAD